MEVKIFLAILMSLVILLMITGSACVNGRQVLEFRKPFFTSDVHDNEAFENLIIVEKELEHICDEISRPYSPLATVSSLETEEISSDGTSPTSRSRDNSSQNVPTISEEGSVNTILQTPFIPTSLQPSIIPVNLSGNLSYGITETEEFSSDGTSPTPRSTDISTQNISMISEESSVSTMLQDSSNQTSSQPYRTSANSSVNLPYGTTGTTGTEELSSDGTSSTPRSPDNSTHNVSTISDESSVSIMLQEVSNQTSSQPSSTPANSSGNLPVGTTATTTGTTPTTTGTTATTTGTTSTQGTNLLRWEQGPHWCILIFEHLFVGDFNGDGKTDLLCHSQGNSYMWIAFAGVNGQFTGTNWHSGMQWCNINGAEIHIGDFNGDGRSDMLCHETGAGYKQVALANTNGDFSTGTSWQTFTKVWCNHDGSKLHIGDFNGDGRDDMLCHDDTGRTWIAYANNAGSFFGNEWEKDINFCNTQGSHLFIGDFSGDAKSDLLCHESFGINSICYANLAGNFDPFLYTFLIQGVSLNIGLQWCCNPGDKLHIADFNEDGKDDLLCQDFGTGYHAIALANFQNDFTDGTSWESVILGGCNTTSVEFHFGDFNRDEKNDILCHDNNGYNWIFYNEIIF